MQSIKILGLGIDPTLWKRLNNHLKVAMQQDQIELKFYHLKYKFSQFKEKSIQRLLEVQPDFLFTSVSFFKHIEDFEAFLINYQSSGIIDFPNVFLIESKPDLFFKQYFKNHQYEEIEFRRFSGIKLLNQSWICTGETDFPLLDISPIPEFELKNEEDEIYVDKYGSVGFVPWKKIKKLSWKNETYSLDQFRELFLRQLDSNSKLKEYKGILIEGERAFFSPGFLMRDIIRLKTDSFPIDHIISTGQIKARKKDFSLFVYKLSEMAKSRSNLKLNSELLSNELTIKSNVPVTVDAAQGIIKLLFKTFLEEDGFQNVVLAGESDSGNRFLLKVKPEIERNSHINEHTIQVDDELVKKLVELETNLDDADSILKDSHPADSNLTKKLKNQQIKQVNRAKDRLKNLTNTKVKEDQKRYLDMMSQSRIELIRNLVEISETWEDENCDLAVARYENVLVFYDKEEQKLQISRHLTGENQQVFYDVSKETADLHSIVQSDAEKLESYLSHGMVICCSSSRELLLRRFQEFENELTKREYPSLTEAIESLNQEIEKGMKRIRELSFREDCNSIKDHYSKSQADLIEATKRYHQSETSKRFKTQQIKKVCIFAPSEQRCIRLQQALIASNGRIKPHNCHRFTNSFDLDFISFAGETERRSKSETEENQLNQLAEINANRLSDYFRKLWQELGLRDCDLIVIEGELEMVSLTIDFFRQPQSKYRSTSIISLYHGNFEPPVLEDLSVKGVTFLYLDQFQKENDEYLTGLFKQL